MPISKSQSNIADMLRKAGRKVSVIDATKDPRVVADERLRAEQKLIHDEMADDRAADSREK